MFLGSCGTVSESSQALEDQVQPHVLLFSSYLHQVFCQCWNASVAQNSLPKTGCYIFGIFLIFLCIMMELGSLQFLQVTSLVDIHTRRRRAAIREQKFL